MTNDLPENLLTATDFRRAATKAFAFLTEYGFALTPSATSTTDTVTVEYVRSDALVQAKYSGKSFWLTVMPPNDDDATLTVGARMRRFKARYAATKEFPRHPLRTADPDEAGRTMASYAARFVVPVAESLRQSPPDFARIGEVIEAFEKQLSDETWLAVMRRDVERAWSEQHWRRVVWDYELIKHTAELTDEEVRRLEKARELMPVHAHIIVRQHESDHEWILRCAALVTEKQTAINEAAERRREGHGDLNRIAHWETVQEFHEAMRLLYPADFWQAVAQVQAGDPDGLERVIVFLEADPWAFRSGYVKEYLTRILLRHQFTEEQRQRLRRVILHAVDVGDRREFVGYCRLGRKLDDASLHAELLVRLRSDDPGIARRALWALSYLRDLQLAPDDLKLARQVILRGADDPENWRRFRRKRPNWIRNLGRKYWSEDWQAELQELANDPDRGDAATRVLRSIGIRLPDTHGHNDPKL